MIADFLFQSRGALALIALVAGLMAISAAVAQDAYPGEGVNYDDRGGVADYAHPGMDVRPEFRRALDPHGGWIEHPGYGMVWAPYANEDVTWRPYVRGQWIFTNDYGWYWQSDEIWGWVTYHYGRWTRADGYGWIWVPGDEWAPAWVAWRHGDGYVGWAPLPPVLVGYRDGSYGSHHVSVAIGAPEFAPVWIFVSHARFIEPRVHRYVVPHRRNRRYLKRSRIVAFAGHRAGRAFNRGIERRMAERWVRRAVPVRQIRRLTRPGPIKTRRRNARFVEIYRPELKPFVARRAIPRVNRRSRSHSPPPSRNDWKGPRRWQHARRDFDRTRAAPPRKLQRARPRTPPGKVERSIRRAGSAPWRQPRSTVRSKGAPQPRRMLDALRAKSRAATGRTRSHKAAGGFVPVPRAGSGPRPTFGKRVKGGARPPHRARRANRRRGQ